MPSEPTTEQLDATTPPLRAARRNIALLLAQVDAGREVTFRIVGSIWPAAGETRFTSIDVPADGHAVVSLLRAELAAIDHAIAVLSRCRG